MVRDLWIVRVEAVLERVASVPSPQSPSMLSEDQTLPNTPPEVADRCGGGGWEDGMPSAVDGLGRGLAV